jgi:hypothetical protein
LQRRELFRPFVVIRRIGAVVNHICASAEVARAGWIGSIAGEYFHASGNRRLAAAGDHADMVAALEQFIHNGQTYRASAKNNMLFDVHETNSPLPGRIEDARWYTNEING